jgi:hypothetical protein|tara:strand:+ start:1066 stop:1305 length:240 start_codon:yes stop_codon:yes gene_type:complete
VELASTFLTKKEYMTDDNSVDKSFENEVTPSPMVQISVKDYDKLKERNNYITNKSLIEYIDKIEFFVKELRKHIVRTDI